MNQRNVTTHGLARKENKHPLYWTWDGIKKRCYNPNRKEYNRYGARGIKMCDEWRNDFKSFHDWALFNGWAKGLTIERKDNNGNYEPNNCCWVTMEQQSKNRKNNIVITILEETKILADWFKDERCNITKMTAYRWSRKQKRTMLEVVTELIKTNSTKCPDYKLTIAPT